jgi:hypothetical protein
MEGENEAAEGKYKISSRKYLKEDSMNPFLRKVAGIFMNVLPVGKELI